MEISLPVEVEARLARHCARLGFDPSVLVAEWVERDVTEWLPELPEPEPSAPPPEEPPLSASSKLERDEYGHLVVKASGRGPITSEMVKEMLEGMHEPCGDYLTEMFRELERLWPTAGAMSHGIAWDEESKALTMLFNIGDVVLAYPLSPSDLGHDPVTMAAKLAFRGKAEAEKPDADYQMITFKR